jgi:hypothetical protein
MLFNRMVLAIFFFEFLDTAFPFKDRPLADMMFFPIINTF